MLYNDDLKQEKNEVSAQGVYTPYKEGKSKDFTNLRKGLLKLLEINDLNTLKQEFLNRNFSKKHLSEFFEQEHQKILDWLLLDSTSNECFQFIVDTFSGEAIQHKLKEDNFFLLRRFLNRRAAVEEVLGFTGDGLTVDKRELDVQRFQLLLKVDPTGIKDFMEKNQKESFMKTSTLEDYKKALCVTVKASVV